MEDLTWALEDPEIKAIFCVRGGYGASEIADILSEERIRSAGKLIIGYSDITVYHSAWTKNGLISIQACMSGAFDPELPKDMGDYTGSTRGGKYTSVADMISRQFLADLDIPVAFGFPAGHGEYNYPLLMGATAELNVGAENYVLTCGAK
ncbi:MAG: LD-carboxypeptidase [Eubacterium sp.]|nr:LD-carboxypeptidase [Eubacterium sp.]